jgi:hypothetical protein
MGQKGSNITARCKVYERHIRLYQLEKSVISILLRNWPQNWFWRGHILRSTGYMDRLVKEAIKIRLHPNNFNKGNGFMLSQA